jgi:uncharacterized protein YycO
MKNIGFVVALTLTTIVLTPLAVAENTAQQNKMTTCNKGATGMKGDERKAFMSNCLKKDQPMTQQDKMKQCNKDATGKKGDERKAFMSECLKK